MEIIRGKHASFINRPALIERLTAYNAVHIDIGTGDGRFVQSLAQTQPNQFAIGIDACRENLLEISRRESANTMFVIANAQELPTELYGLAAQITINFPWGSLLEGILLDDPGLLVGLREIMQPKARLEIRLNGGALAEAGWSLEDGAAHIRHILLTNSFDVRSQLSLTATDLKSYPTTWAKRLAFGRDPRAIYLQARRIAERIIRVA